MKLAKEMEVDQEGAHDMETKDSNKEDKNIGKGSTASSSGEQPQDQARPRTSGIPSFTLPKVPSPRVFLIV
jgi:hypothetical protein